MRTYEIKKCNKDFKFTNEINNKGTRPKRTAVDARGRKAIFKYQMYNCSEACSEKLSCEFAKILGYECADIEFARNGENTLGILNYLFVNVEKQEHTDAIAYIKKENEDRKEFYTLDNVKNCLDKLNTELFKEL